MAKLDKDNPLKPIHEKVTRIRDVLDYVLSLVLNGGKAVFSGLRIFLKNLKANLPQIAAKVGKAAVNGLIKQGEKLLASVDTLKKTAGDAKKAALKIIATVEKAIKEPQRVFKAVKGMVARLAKLFRQVVQFVRTLVAMINPIAAVLKVIDTFKLVLRLMLKWISDVTGILKGVKRVETTVKKAVKLLQAELKNVTLLVKEANALKPA